MQAPPFDEVTFLRFFRTLDERQARLCAAERALAPGWGGITRLARVTGLSREPVRQGIAARRAATSLAPGRGRRPGGGRTRVEAGDPALGPALQAGGDDPTGGSPEDALTWTAQAKAALAPALAGRGHRGAPNPVGRLLRDLGDGLPATRQDKEGRAPPERDAPVRYLNAQVRAFLQRGQPVLSVDTRKKELVGECKHAGRTWRPTGTPGRVTAHDVPSQRRGKAIPSGVDDVGQNRGVGNAGTSHAPPAFAVESLRLWWEPEGRARSPAAAGVLICAARGGSNSGQSRGWKARLQDLADRLRVPIPVCPLPPGTSQWNKIEHRLCSYSSIHSIHWRGRPLVDYETGGSLIGATSTTTGLTVTARLDLDDYPTGVAVPDAGTAHLALHPHAVHPQWNYTLTPRPT